MANTNQDHLLTGSVVKGGFSVPKNLVWLVMGILIAAVILVVAMQVAFTEAPPQTVTLKPTADTSQPPSSEVIDGIAQKQRSDALKQKEEEERQAQARAAEAAMVATKGPLPGSFPQVDGSGKINLPIPAGLPNSAEEDTSLNAAAAREELIRSAPILALSDSAGMAGMAGDTATVATGGPAGDPGLAAIERERQSSQGALEEQMRRAASMMGDQGGPAPVVTRAKMETDWMTETAQLNKGSVPLRGNTPTSRFLLMQGSIINAVTLNAMNTDLPGEIRARTTMDVYDSIRGEYLLIPKGTTLIGRYNSDVRVGQDRINTGFRRIILPNGISVDLNGNIGQDASGAAGIPGDVNNHYGRMFYVSFLTALGAYVTERSNPAQGGTTVNTGTGAINNAAGQIFSDVNRAVIQRNSGMAPTITTPAGIPFTINVANDIELPPYRVR